MQRIGGEKPAGLLRQNDQSSYAFRQDADGVVLPLVATAGAGGRNSGRGFRFAGEARQWPAGDATRVSGTLLAVQRIASHNALGKQPQAFTITAGSMAAQLAEQRKLCQPDQCEFFSLLDPFRSYGRDWDELIRQSYGVGDLEAWSASSGTVILAQVSFRAYGPRRGWLACTVAHELAHIRRNHFFSTAITTTTPADMPRRSDASNSAMPADAPRKNRRIAIPR